MIRTELTHGRGWLDADAAASIGRIDAELGRPLDINSAGRTPQEQQQAVDRMNAGGPFALPVGQSIHEQGEAADSDDGRNPEVVALMRRHGWIRTALQRKPSEWWHFEYRIDLDQHRNDPAPTTKEDDVETYVLHENDNVYYLRRGVKKRFTSVDDYNAWKTTVDTLRGQGATSMISPPPLRKLRKLADWRFQAIAGVYGV